MTFLKPWQALKAYDEGLVVEWRNRENDWRKLGGPYFRSGWPPGEAFAEAAERGYSFRLRPEPRRRPWRLEEVPRNHWYRRRAAPEAELAIRKVLRPSKDREETLIDLGTYVSTLKGLFSGWEHSPTALPGTWEPCTIEEESC